MAAATVAQIAGVSARRHGAGGRIVHGPRACARAGCRDRWRPLRQRLEGDQRRGGQARDRELRSQALVVIMGGRFKSGDFSLLREPLRARAATVVAIGEAAPLIREALEGCRADRGCRDDGGGSSSVVRAGESGSCNGAGRGVFATATRDGRAGARVRELRHVPRLRGAWSGVQEGSDEAEQGRGAARGDGVPASTSGEQSSVGHRRIGSWLLGTQAAPVCEAGVPTSGLTDDC